MQSVDYVYRWWVLRACGRNPLVRGVDRLELVIIALGILVVLAAAACAPSSTCVWPLLRLMRCSSSRATAGEFPRWRITQSTG